MKAHVSKHKNHKQMLCPQRQLRLSDFARDVVDGIIWDGVKEHKVHPRALSKMQYQTSMGIMVNKELLRKRELERLQKILRATPNDSGGRPSILSTGNMDDDDAEVDSE